MSTDDDAALVRGAVERARNADAEAWEWLYRRSRPRLYAFARRRLPSAAADDAVSETMMRAIERIDRFTWQGAGFEAWLFAILRNVVLEHLRHSRRDADGTDPGAGAADDPDPADSVVAAAEHQVMRRAFARLSPTDREILELRVVAELSAEEAGEVLSRRAGAVRMAQSRALARLRRHLREGDRG